MSLHTYIYIDLKSIMKDFVYFCLLLSEDSLGRCFNTENFGFSLNMSFKYFYFKEIHTLFKLVF